MIYAEPSRKRAQFQLSLIALVLIAGVVGLPNLAGALNGGTLRVTPYNGWKAFEIISSGENPSGDGFNYSMPGTFDGAGAWMVDATTLRVLVNHEQTVASISEVNLDLAALESAIDNMITVGNTGGSPSSTQRARPMADGVPTAARLSPRQRARPIRILVRSVRARPTRLTPSERTGASSTSSISQVKSGLAPTDSSPSIM